MAALVIAAVLSLALAAPAHGATPARATRAATVRTLPSVERLIRRCLNRERTSRGLAPLIENPMLDAAARLHANNMARHGFFAHDDPWGRGPAERVALFDPARTLDLIGENIAAGHPSAAAACRGWMASPGHRANMLDPAYTQVGSGVVRTPRGYGFYYVQDFGVLASAPPTLEEGTP